MKHDILRIFGIMLLLNFIPIVSFADQKKDSIQSIGSPLDSIFQIEKLDTLKTESGSFGEIINEKFIEGPEDSWRSYLWVILTITGILMWIGLMIIIFYHSYKILKKIFGK